jgi:hypothetical protein
VEDVPDEESDLHKPLPINQRYLFEDTREDPGYTADQDEPILGINAGIRREQSISNVSSDLMCCVQCNSKCTEHANNGLCVSGNHG